MSCFGDERRYQSASSVFASTVCPSTVGSSAASPRSVDQLSLPRNASSLQGIRQHHAPCCSSTFFFTRCPCGSSAYVKIPIRGSMGHPLVDDTPAGGPSAGRGEGLR